MDIHQIIADRLVIEGQRQGAFSNLPGHGKPIDDLHIQRPSGWWGERMVKAERHQLLADNLDEASKEAVRCIWSLTSENQVRDVLGQTNAQRVEYNRLTSLEPKPLLNTEELVTRWRRSHRAKLQSLHRPAR